jgi:hypothetical protein
MVAAAQLSANQVAVRIAWIRAARRAERRRPTSRSALVETAIAWLAQVTGQAPDAARAKLLLALGSGRDALSAPTRDEAERALEVVAELAGGAAVHARTLAELRALLEELGD